MKRKLIILFVLTLFFISGCSNATKKEAPSKNDSKSSSITESEKQESNTKSEDNTKQEKTDDENTNNQQQNEASTEVPASSKVENAVQTPVQPTCTPKKFDNTYSYVYSTQEECKKEGNIAFMNITDTEDSDIFAYGCRQIVDDCGTTYYGVIFYNAPDSVVYR